MRTRCPLVDKEVGFFSVRILLEINKKQFPSTVHMRIRDGGEIKDDSIVLYRSKPSELVLLMTLDPCPIT